MHLGGFYQIKNHQQKYAITLQKKLSKIYLYLLVSIYLYILQSISLYLPTILSTVIRGYFRLIWRVVHQFWAHGIWVPKIKAVKKTKKT